MLAGATQRAIGHSVSEFSLQYAAPSAGQNYSELETKVIVSHLTGISVVNFTHVVCGNRALPDRVMDGVVRSRASSKIIKVASAVPHQAEALNGSKPL
eukprot:scaffold556368_cov47-Prasinocladus_malaysianus.AAC.1